MTKPKKYNFHFVLWGQKGRDLQKYLLKDKIKGISHSAWIIDACEKKINAYKQRKNRKCK